MKAEVTATSVKIVVEFSQRELELFHALMNHLTGFKGEEISQVDGSAAEFTEIARGLATAARQQVRNVETGGGDQRLSPRVAEGPIA